VVVVVEVLPLAVVVVPEVCVLAQH